MVNESIRLKVQQKWVIWKKKIQEACCHLIG